MEAEMAAREFTCEIVNTGAGTLTIARHNLDHGVWTIKPYEAPQSSIKPGEAITFKSESSGIMTGTEGFVTYGGTTEAGFVKHPDFFKIYWNLPYLITSTPSIPSQGPELHRFDPDAAPDPFLGRDQGPSNLTWTGFCFNPNDGSFLTEMQNAPNVLPIWVWLANKDLPDHIGMHLEVGGTVADDSGSLVFPTNPPPKTTTSPLKGSSASVWIGAWTSDSVDATIAPADGGGLLVDITEKGAGAEAFARQQVRIVNRLTPFRPIDAPGGSTPELHPAGHRPIDVTVTPDKTAPDGDYVMLASNASLEILSVSAAAATIGQALFYRRPTLAVLNNRVSPGRQFADVLHRRVHIG
ncbi:MAG: hypothetical protein JO227_11510 [Acetobacteraceae bacterium]|nr:hypothetical protein [Acetobacteraceae bacterium]